MKKIVLKISSFYVLCVFLSGCASAAGASDTCPSVEDEPVSTCRARLSCRQEKTSYGVGLGVGLGANLGLGVSQSQNTENYTNCIDQNMKQQESVEQIVQPERGVSAEKIK